MFLIGALKPFNGSGEFEGLVSEGNGLGRRRKLAPTDFGLVMMVTTLSLLLANFGFTGTPEATIQREDRDYTLAIALFPVILAAGFGTIVWE